MKFSTKTLSIVICVLLVLSAGVWLYTKNQEVVKSVEMHNVQSAQNSESQKPISNMVDTSSSTNIVEPKTQSTETTVPLDTNARATTLVAGGCFWCTEADLEKLPGVLEAVSGYADGTNESPTYQNYAEFGHREVAEATYNPTVVSFKELIVYAIKHMDPTDADGSFHDRGPQYAPALYYDNDIEKQTITNVISQIDALHVYDKPIALLVLPRPKFWKAEDYHQNYYRGSLTQLKYKYYRNASGRDAFIEKYWGSDTGPDLPAERKPFDVSQWEKFVKPSDADLKAKLTPMQYGVTQNHDTEAPFDNAYWHNYEDGIYVDVVSGEPLFSSLDKFDSGTGWPSFTKPIYPEAVKEYVDYKLIVPRTEIRSQFVGSHLGHKFNDAPAELGGIRYCMNSASLLFIPKAEMEAKGYGEFLALFK